MCVCVDCQSMNRQSVDKKFACLSADRCSFCRPTGAITFKHSSPITFINCKILDRLTVIRRSVDHRSIISTCWTAYNESGDGHLTRPTHWIDIFHYGFIMHVMTLMVCFKSLSTRGRRECKNVKISIHESYKNMGARLMRVVIG